MLGLGQTPISLFCVYDGHGGPTIAEYVAKHLHVNILNDESFAEEPIEAIREGFLSTNEALFQYIEREGMPDTMGCTAVFTMIQEQKLYVAYAGDSEACIYRKSGEYKPLVDPHKPKNPREQEKIQQMGGFVEEKGGILRVCGQLAVSRAFGDVRFRQYITADPDIIIEDLNGDEEFLPVMVYGM